MDTISLTDWLLNQSIPLVILCGLGWFMLAKLWPWLTEVYIPAQQQIDEKMAESFVQVALHLENSAAALDRFAEAMVRFCEDETQ
jgi:hypothetical protein